MKRSIVFVLSVLSVISLIISFSISGKSSHEVITNLDSLSAGENGYGGHSTVVFCGGEHPRFWRTGCCEGAGSCTSDCELDYSC